MVALIVCGISAPGNFTSRLTPEVIGWTLDYVFGEDPDAGDDAARISLIWVASRV
jgi:hypothetical protein